MYYFPTPQFYICLEVDEAGCVLRASLQSQKPPYSCIQGKVHDALQKYFDNHVPLPASLISQNISGTDFQKKVWSAISAIPFGGTADYQSIASSIGSPLAYRAVGTACGKNPVALFIPCHRVVRKHSEDFGYSWGKDNKKWLLEFESNR